MDAEQTELEIHGQPTTSDWSSDWARAEEQASAYEEQFDGQNESEQQAEQSADEGSHDDGTQDAQSGSEEGGVEGSREAEDREGESDLGSERGSEDEAGDEQRDGDSSQQGRERRELRESQSSGAVDSEELEAFKAQAEKLGFSIDDRQVAKQERVSLRQERKEMRARLAEERSEVEQRLQQQASQIEEKYSTAIALQQAIDDDNLDGIAQAAGYKDWTEINRAFLNKSMNPQHKEMMAMRRQLKQQQEREQQFAKEQQQRQAQERYQLKVREEKRDIADDISDIGEYERFADDPMFVDAVFHHRKAHWDGVETISVKEAAKLAHADARKLYDQLHSRFGDRSTQTSETPASGATAEKPVGATGKRRIAPKTVSQKQVADASAQADPDVLDERAWAQKWGLEIKNSTPSVG